MLFLWLCSVSDSTRQTGAVLRTSIQTMEEVILNFPGKMISSETVVEVEGGNDPLMIKPHSLN